MCSLGVAIGINKRDICPLKSALFAQWKEGRSLSEQVEQLRARSLEIERRGRDVRVGQLRRRGRFALSSLPQFQSMRDCECVGQRNAIECFPVGGEDGSKGKERQDRRETRRV